MATIFSKTIFGVASRAAIAVSICAALGACSLMMTDVEVGGTDTDTDTDSDSDTDIDSDTDSDSDSDTDTDCTPDAYQQCYGEGEGDVYNFDSCDIPGDLVDDCPDVNGTCVDLDAEHAECQCLGNFDIATDCAQCLGNWDPAGGCATCLSGFADVEGDDCGTCVRFVDAAATAAGDGLTWDAAHQTIQTGIYSASAAVTAVDGPEYCHVWVKAGTYAPTEGSGDDATVLLVDGVRVYGGFSGAALAWADRDPAVNVTTVDGAGVYHVVTGADGAVINGFFITGGNTQSSGGGIDGAGMYNVDVSPRIEECTFNDNFSESDGGGMYNAGTAAPVIVGCTFTGNTAESNGAAIANGGTSAPTIEDCLFEDNEAASGMGTGNGGAISGTSAAVVAISRCTFRTNLAIEHGGAIYFTAATGSISISESTFDGNALQFGGGANDGGAVYLNGTTATIDRCAFSSNGAPNGGRGGGLYAALSTSTIVNTAFLQNTVGSSTGGNYGGAIYATGGTMAIMNCTVYGNAATTSAENLGGGFYLSSSANVDIQNTIIWGNTPLGIYTATGGSCSNVYSDLQDGAGNPDYNNISLDPVFVGGAPYDLHLQGASPCIDEGTASGAPSVDLDGDPRPSGDGYDIGAYEF